MFRKLCAIRIAGIRFYPSGHGARKYSEGARIFLKRSDAASIAFSIRHKFEPGFPCLSHSLCLLCFDVPLFSVVSHAPRPLLIDFR